MTILMAMIMREYMERVHRKGFLIGTIITPLLMLSYLALPFLFATHAGGERHVVVLDQSNDPVLFQSIKQRVADESQGTRFVLTQEVVPPDTDVDQIRRQLNAGIEKDPDSAYIVLRPGVLENEAPEYYASNVSDLSIGVLNNSISTVINQRRLVHAGVDPNKIDQFTRRVEMKTIKVSSQGETEKDFQNYVTPFVLVIFIYFTVFPYSNSVMRGVIEDKQTRIVEVLITAVKPYAIMLSKLIGIGLVGITQFFIWALTLLAISAGAKSLLDINTSSLPEFTVRIAIYFGIFFILGYFLYGTLYLIVGAMVSRFEDAQQLARSLTVLNVLPMFLFWLVMRDPNSTVSVLLSMVPFLAPTLMLLRIAIITPPLWQILLTIFLIIVSIAIALQVAARVFRIGVLIYGKKATLNELGRWLRYA